LSKMDGGADGGARPAAMGDLAHGERVPPLGELAPLPEDLTREELTRRGSSPVRSSPHRRRSRRSQPPAGTGGTEARVRERRRHGQGPEALRSGAHAVTDSTPQPRKVGSERLWELN
jgi:hypothetical protein